MGMKPRSKRGGVRAGAGAKPKPRNIASYKAAGPPPDDPLERIKWAQQMMAITMGDVAIDLQITDRQRRQELRATAKVMADLVPRERLWDAEQAIREDMSQIDKPPEPKMDDAKKQPVTSLRTKA